jgi:hypothetical protein
MGGDEEPTLQPDTGNENLEQPKIDDENLEQPKIGNENPRQANTCNEIPRQAWIGWAPNDLGRPQMEARARGNALAVK